MPGTESWKPKYPAMRIALSRMRGSVGRHRGTHSRRSAVGADGIDGRDGGAADRWRRMAEHADQAVESGRIAERRRGAAAAAAATSASVSSSALTSARGRAAITKAAEQIRGGNARRRAKPPEPLDQRRDRLGANRHDAVGNRRVQLVHRRPAPSAAVSALATQPGEHRGRSRAVRRRSRQSRDQAARDGRPGSDRVLRLR